MSLSLFFSLFLLLFLLARRSGLRFLRGTRLRSPAASCLYHFFPPTFSSRSADPRIIVLCRLTVPRDPVRSWLRVSSAALCSRETAFHRSVMVFRICIVDGRVNGKLAKGYEISGLWTLFNFDDGYLIIGEL